MPLVEALERWAASGEPVRVVPVTPPSAVKVKRWRIARVGDGADGMKTVTVVAEIEGTIGCNER